MEPDVPSCRRPWPTATTPHAGQPVTASPVSTCSSRPVPVAVTDLMWMPLLTPTENRATGLWFYCAVVAAGGCFLSR
jgi:hypothetical protein